MIAMPIIAQPDRRSRPRVVGEMVGQRRLLGDIGFDIARFARSSPPPGRTRRFPTIQRFQFCPVPRRELSRARRRMRFRPPSRDSRQGREKPQVRSLQSPSRLARRIRLRLLVLAPPPKRRCRSLGIGGVFSPLEKRIALSSSSTNAASSTLEYCRSLIACNSCGVITRDWPCRSSILADKAIETRELTDREIKRPISCIHPLSRLQPRKNCRRQCCGTELIWEIDDVAVLLISAIRPLHPEPSPR